MLPQHSLASMAKLSAVVSDDGKSVTATYSADAKAGRSFWGGAIKGLTYGEGKQYTISMKMAVATYTNDSGALASGNAGVFINMPKNTESQYLLDRLLRLSRHPSRNELRRRR